MTVPGMVGAGQRTNRCCVCGIPMVANAGFKNVAGSLYCATCYESLAEGASPGEPVSADATRYQCSICARSFNVEDVYEKNGQIICKTCFAERSPQHAAPAPAATEPSRKSAKPHGGLKLLPRVTCPHCWHQFPHEDVLWVAQHAELLGDQVLGPEVSARFLPSRFTVDGQAIDARGMTCQLLACPQCHLVCARAILESEPLFLSIVGVPSSGKSYFVTAMTWELRRLLPARFAVGFNDADTVTNRSLNEYEETLFLHGNADELVAIRKTELQGELYDQVRLGQHILSLPRPFLFTMKPTSQHANAAKAEQFSRLICVYDNAGEHFQPGMDSASSPVTQHLARSRAIMFLYDPTQDPRLRDQCRQFSPDPQLANTAPTHRQETILTEAALRIRRYAGMSPSQKHDRPLIVVVPKSDVWGPLIGVDVTKDPIVEGAFNGVPLNALDVPRVELVSSRVRALLQRYAPEFVAAAEDFCQYVIYIPVSALGRAPELDSERGMLGIRPRDIRPAWVTVPMLYMFAKWSKGMIAGIVQPASAANVTAATGKGAVAATGGRA